MTTLRPPGRLTAHLAVAAVAIFGTLVPAAHSVAHSRGAVTVAEVSVESQATPLGIDVERPRLGWILQSRRNDQRQTAYQVQVATSGKALARGTADVWDSGKVESAASVDVTYDGPSLDSATRYFWRVRVWDGRGRSSSWSEPSWWETGLLEPSDWTSSWISHPYEDPTFDKSSWVWHAADGSPVGTVERYFRRSFTLPDDREIMTAKLVVAADNEVDLHVNETKVADSHLLPGHMGSGWMAGQLADVTDLLHPGDNVLAAHASNTGTAAGLIMRLEVTFTDGERFELSTDDQWRSAAEPAPGWKAGGFDDTAWDAVEVLGAYPMSPWNDRLRVPRTPVYVRDDFEVSGTVKQARLYSSALGVYKAYLNGETVSSDEMAPGWTDYAEKVPYQTYDVTKLVREGKNAIGAVVAEGWYGGTLMGGGANRYGDVLAVNAQLVIEYADGTVQTVSTGDEWTAGYGAIQRSQIYDGEYIDAREEQAGWNTRRFDDSGWTSAAVNTAVSPRLVAAQAPPMTVVDDVRPVSVEEIADDVYRFDLGQNISGRVQLAVDGEVGTVVELKHAELLDADGGTDFRTLRNAAQVDTFVLSGDGREVFEPSFTTHGFRYVEVRGLPEEPSLDDLVGRVISTDLERTGTFSTSDPRLDAIQDTIEWGQRSNFTAVPTDCPQRDERLGWTGDVAGYAATATYNADVVTYFEKWLDDLHEAQEPDGAVPSVAPRAYNGANGGEGVSGWGDAIVTVPWTLYERYGDVAVLVEHYPAMQQWISYLEDHSTDLLRPGTAYGDWLASDASPKDVVDTAYFGYSARLVAQIAGVLGYDEDAARYGELHEAIADAFSGAYVSSDGTITGDTQAVYVLALQADLLNGDVREAAQQHLIASVEAADGHVTTGYMATPFLLDAVTEAGRVDLAYQIAQQETYPGWLYMLRQDATTWWERWNAIEPDGNVVGGSLNHFALGSVGDWMYKSIAGIAPDESAPGYQHSVIRPRPGGDLTHAEGSLQSPYGELSSEWQIRGRSFHLEVEVPVNATATVYVPTTDGSTVEAARGLEPVEVGDDFAAFEVGSGTWRFVGQVAEEVRDHDQVSVLALGDGVVPVLPGATATATFEVHNWEDHDVRVRPEVAATSAFEVSADWSRVTVPAGESVLLDADVRRTDDSTGDGGVTLTLANSSATVALEATDDWARIATMSASSTHSKWSPARTNDGDSAAQHDYSLWNAGDGWNDATRASWPDTLTATWDDMVTLDRLRIRTVDQPNQSPSTHGLRDYDVQGLVDGEWLTVGSVRGNTAATIDTTFEPIETTGVRISVLDTNDQAYSRVVEFEAYAS
jgi:alpha-L-rhamnosidase